MNRGSESRPSVEPIDGGLIANQLPTPRIAPPGKTLWNACVRFGAQFISIVANLLATPYIIRHLGIESYGIVGVISTVISFTAIVTSSLTSTVGRNLTFAIERQEYENANKEISTAFYGLGRLLAIAFFPLTAFCIFIDHLVVIPNELILGARLFSFLAICSFALSAMSGPLGAAMFVRNRLDLLSGASLLRSLFVIGVIVGLFSSIGANLTTYGIAGLSGSVLLYYLHKRIHRYLLPGIEISIRWFDRRILQGILSLGGWMTLNQVGALLFLQTDLLVANRILGPGPSGQFAAISVIPLQMRVLAGLLSGLFAPTQAALAARNDGAALSRYVLRSIRLTGLFFALLVGVFCGSARDILTIWLGEEFSFLTPVAFILTAYLVISLSVSPTSDTVLILGRVRVPAIVTVTLGIANVVLGIILTSRFGLLGLALSGCIMLSLRNAVFTPWYVSRVCKMSVWSVWREQGLAMICCTATYLISYVVNLMIHPANMNALCISLLLSATLGTFLLAPVAFRATTQKL